MCRYSLWGKNKSKMKEGKEVKHNLRSTWCIGEVTTVSTTSCSCLTVYAGSLLIVRRLSWSDWLFQHQVGHGRPHSFSPHCFCWPCRALGGLAHLAFASADSLPVQACKAVWQRYVSKVHQGSNRNNDDEISFLNKDLVIFSNSYVSWGSESCSVGFKDRQKNIIRKLFLSCNKSWKRNIENFGTSSPAILLYHYSFSCSCCRPHWIIFFKTPTAL